MGKFEKIIFGSAIFLQYMFFGVLNIALFLGLPNSLISGGTRLLILVIGILLMFLDWKHRQYGRLTLPVIAFIGFALYYAVVFVMEPSMNFLRGWDYVALAGGKRYFAYTLFVVGWGVSLLFFCGRARFEFLISHPSLLYIPSLLGTLLILWVNRGALSGLDLANAANDFANRSIVKPSMGILFAVSLYYVLFDPNWLRKVFMGLTGLAISGANLIISDSKSSILSFGVIAIFYFLLSLRRLKTAVFTSAVYIVAAVGVLPVLFTSKAWERLTAMEGYQEMYLSGSAELSRWDMIVEGWNRFTGHAFFGDGIYTSWGAASTHFLPLEVLVPTGLFGAVLFGIAAFGMARGMIYLIRTSTVSYWVLGIVAMEISDQFFHGYTVALFCFSTAILLCADCIRRMRPLMLPLPLAAAPLPPDASSDAGPQAYPPPPRQERPRRRTPVLRHP